MRVYEMESRFTKLLTAAIVSAALPIAACNEIPQDAQMYEKALADRAQTQNEYLVTGNGKKQAPR